MSRKKEAARSNNELGYQCELLFGDLFEFRDYVIDSLHMRLRIFDILLKDILAEASRTGEYEPMHTRKLEERVNVLNQHASKTIGKRFSSRSKPKTTSKRSFPVVVSRVIYTNSYLILRFRTKKSFKRRISLEMLESW